MKTTLFIPALVSLTVLACATQRIDSVTIFTIQGRALDQASNFPLQDVKVYFIDTGYDGTLSKNPTPIEITQSDSRGRIAARFNYWWMRKSSLFDNRAKATFDIVLSRERYASKRLHFKQSELQTDGLSILVDLAEVYLVRKNE